MPYLSHAAADLFSSTTMPSSTSLSTAMPSDSAVNHNILPDSESWTMSLISSPSGGGPHNQNQNNRNHLNMISNHNQNLNNNHHPFTAFPMLHDTSNDMKKAMSDRGQRALAAINAARSAGENAAALAINMAQETNLAANLANQSLSYLERYVYGRPLSAIPANVAPEPPALYQPPSEVAMKGVDFDLNSSKNIIGGIGTLIVAGWGPSDNPLGDVSEVDGEEEEDGKGEGGESQRNNQDTKESEQDDNQYIDGDEILIRQDHQYGSWSQSDISSLDIDSEADEVESLGSDQDDTEKNNPNSKFSIDTTASIWKQFVDQESSNYTSEISDDDAIMSSPQQIEASWQFLISAPAENVQSSDEDSQNKSANDINDTIETQSQSPRLKQNQINQNLTMASNFNNLNFLAWSMIQNQTGIETEAMDDETTNNKFSNRKNLVGIKMHKRRQISSSGNNSDKNFNKNQVDIDSLSQYEQQLQYYNKLIDKSNYFNKFLNFNIGVPQVEILPLLQFLKVPFKLAVQMQDRVLLYYYSGSVKSFEIDSDSESDYDGDDMDGRLNNYSSHNRQFQTTDMNSMNFQNFHSQFNRSQFKMLSNTNVPIALDKIASNISQKINIQNLSLPILIGFEQLMPSFLNIAASTERNCEITEDTQNDAEDECWEADFSEENCQTDEEDEGY